MGNEEELRLKVEITGDQEAAKGLEDVDAASKKVTEQTGASAKKTRDAEKATKKLAASESDLVSLLMTANPLLGQWADGLFKSGKLAAFMAAQNIDWRAAVVKVTAALRANVGMLKLLGATGGVVAGIMAVVVALRAIREEALRVTAAVRGVIDAMTELGKQEAENQQSIETMRDRSGAEPFTADQARAAGQTFKDVRFDPQFDFLSDEALKQALAAVGGRSDRPGGGSRPVNEIAKIAALIEQGKLSIDAGQNQGSIDRRINRALERFGGQLSKVFERELKQVEEQLRAAMGQTGASGGDVSAIEAIAKRRTAGTTAAPQEVAIIVQALKSVLEGLADKSLETTPGGRERFKERVTTGLIRRELARLNKSGDFSLKPSEISGEEVAIARQVMQEIKATLKEIKDDLRNRPTVIDNRNAKIMYPSAPAQREAMRNGDLDIRRRETL